MRFESRIIKTLRGFNRKVSKMIPGWILEGTLKTEKRDCEQSSRFFGCALVGVLPQPRPQRSWILTATVGARCEPKGVQKERQIGLSGA